MLASWHRKKKTSYSRVVELLFLPNEPLSLVLRLLSTSLLLKLSDFIVIHIRVYRKKPHKIKEKSTALLSECSFHVYDLE